MTTPPAATSAPAPKRKGGPDLLTRLAWKLGPSAVIGALVAWLAKDRTSVAPWQIGLVAGVLFFFAWTALSLRLRKAGRSAAHAVKSFTLALVFVAAAAALAWALWLR